MFCHKKSVTNLLSLHEFAAKLVKTDHLISAAFFLQLLFPKHGSPTSLSPTNV